MIYAPIKQCIVNAVLNVILPQRHANVFPFLSFLYLSILIYFYLFLIIVAYSQKMPANSTDKNVPKFNSYYGPLLERYHKGYKGMEYEGCIKIYMHFLSSRSVDILIV